MVGVDFPGRPIWLLCFYALLNLLMTHINYKPKGFHS